MHSEPDTGRVVGFCSELPVLWPFVLEVGFQVGLSVSTLAPGATRGLCPSLPEYR